MPLWARKRHAERETNHAATVPHGESCRAAESWWTAPPLRVERGCVGQFFSSRNSRGRSRRNLRSPARETTARVILAAFRLRRVRYRRHRRAARAYGTDGLIMMTDRIAEEIVALALRERARRPIDLFSPFPDRTSHAWTPRVTLPGNPEGAGRRFSARVSESTRPSRSIRVFPRSRSRPGNFGGGWT